MKPKTAIPIFLLLTAASPLSSGALVQGIAQGTIDSVTSFTPLAPFQSVVPGDAFTMVFTFDDGSATTPGSGIDGIVYLPTESPGGYLSVGGSITELPLEWSSGFNFDFLLTRSSIGVSDGDGANSDIYQVKLSSATANEANLMLSTPVNGTGLGSDALDDIYGGFGNLPLAVDLSPFTGLSFYAGRDSFGQSAVWGTVESLSFSVPGVPEPSVPASLALMVLCGLLRRRKTG